MNKHVISVIGIAIAVVILAMAYRVITGSDGTVKIGENEVSVSSKSISESFVLLDKSSTEGRRLTKTFERSFSFENHSCGTNEDVSVERCVDSGYILAGMIGEPYDLNKDSCGSDFISFEKISEACGEINVHLQGCGFTSIRTCKGHAKYIGKIKLEGYEYE